MESFYWLLLSRFCIVSNGNVAVDAISCAVLVPESLVGMFRSTDGGRLGFLLTTLLRF
jgi:hypothetical protein